MDYTGWLTPTGELIKCDKRAHLDKARQIVKDLGLYIEGKEPDEILRAHGWIRISNLTYNDHGLMFWIPQRVTEYQHQFLHNIYEDDDVLISEQGKTILKYFAENP